VALWGRLRGRVDTVRGCMAMGDEVRSDLVDVVIRQFAEDDLERLSTLLRETPEVMRNGDDVSAETLREQLARPGHEATRDRWVAERSGAPERLVGYAALFKAPVNPRADMLIITHPSERRAGIGSALLERALAGAVALGASGALGYVNQQDTEAAEFARHRGFTEVSAYVQLRADAAHAFPAPAWPAGYSIHPWRGEADLPTLVEAANRCYGDQWGHLIATQDDWTHWLPEIDPRGLAFLFAADGALAGMSRATLRETDGRRAGVIDAPGLIPARRSVELYRALMLHAIGWLAAQNPAEYVVESWGDDPAVIAAYQALGFSISQREAMFYRRLAIS
jgi:mycothiol synthase